MRWWPGRPEGWVPSWPRRTLTSAAASTAVGFDVKRLGQDQRTLTGYLGTSAD